MSREEPLRDQAERLRKRIAKKDEEWGDVEQAGELPPRSRVHQQKQKKKKTKLKLKYPLIRILALFFILIPILSLSIYTINKNKNSNVEPVINEQDNYETVDFGQDEKEIEQEPTNEPEAGAEEAENHGDEDGSDSSSSIPGDAEQELSVPTPNEKSSGNEQESGTKEEEQTKIEEKVIYHKVQSKETLYRIAKKYYQSPAGVEIIKKANNLHNDEILAGQTLKIPLN